ncbi:MAG: ABC transporter ATP-binding protein [Alphaproteobacteria bacterium]|nr:ABC transporter ATP-binding protein [Alphaproteobacteria bacterium]
MNEVKPVQQVPPGPETLARPILQLSGITRTFRQGGQTLEVLRGVSFSVRGGEMVALVGPSGSGKSTLLHVAGLLERADGGEIFINGRSCSRLSDDERTKLRRRTLGFVYQYHHLLPEFSALENVVLPQMIAGMNKKRARDRASKLLWALGLADREKHRPAQLSGGEQQRVAVARALANSPKMLIADEPTGNLDHDTADSVFKQLEMLVHGTGIAGLIATHNMELARRMDRILALEGGMVIEQR